MIVNVRVYLWTIIGLLLWILADAWRLSHPAPAGEWGHSTFTALGTMAFAYAACRLIWPYPSETPAVMLKFEAIGQSVQPRVDVAKKVH